MSYRCAAAALSLFLSLQVWHASYRADAAENKQRWVSIFQAGSSVDALWRDSGSKATVFARTYDGMFVTRDGGFSWMPFIWTEKQGQSVFGGDLVFAQSTSEPQIMYIGSSTGSLKRSDDGG